jgi:hypothetical protein
VIKVTIDSHVLIGGLDGTDQEQAIFNELCALQQNRIIDVAISNRFRQDKAQDSIIERRARHLLVAQQFSEISSPFRISVLQDHGFFGLKSTAACLNHIFNIREGNLNTHTIWDADHLYGHLASNHDYFLTTENRILKKRPFLKQIKVNVADPVRFLQALREVMTTNIWCQSDFKPLLTNHIEILHPDTSNPKFNQRLNQAINEYLSLEAAELAQLEFDHVSEDPSSPVGQVIAIILKHIGDEGLLGVAKHEYKRFKQQYEKEGAVYGDNHLGLIHWINQRYEAYQSPWS